MSDAITYEDEIPQSDGPYGAGLWAEARWWVGHLAAVFGDLKAIAAVGLSRRIALRCRNWLWSIEGMVRRLIIAAALALDASKLAPLAPATRTPQPVSAQPAQELPEQSSSSKPSAAFRLFSIHRPRKRVLVIGWERLMTMKLRKKRTRAPLPLHRHLAFPADSLMLIGAADARRKPKKTALRRRNPLDRRGRISRWDPDYQGRSEEEEQASYNQHFFGPFPERTLPIDRPPEDKREAKHRDIHDPYRFSGGGLFEFRRIEEEWSRVIPAPDLAGRILALVRVMEKPDRFIERLARMLNQSAKLATKLLATPEPKLEKPKRDSTPAPPGLDCLKRCHAAMPRGDTS